MKHLVVIGWIWLTWQAGEGPHHRLYVRPSTEKLFKLYTTSGPENAIHHKMDARRNWYFFVTSVSGNLESRPSNILYIPRGL